MSVDPIATQDEDFRLATRIKNERCEPSFNRLYEKYKRLVHWKCYQHLFNHEDAEDATQGTFATFWHKASKKWRGGSGGSVKAYLCHIARYEASYIRKIRSAKKRSGEMVSLDETDANGKRFQLADPRAEYHAIIEKEIEIEMDRVLMLMPRQWRLSWILHRREGYSCTDAAMICDAHRQTVHNWTRKADAFIKKCMQRFYDELNDDTTRIEQRASLRALFGE